MAWNKPNRQEIDGPFYPLCCLRHFNAGLDWEKLGNKGWNWDDLAKYSAKSSSLVVSCATIICIYRRTLIYRFVPASLSAEEIARRGLGAGSGWDKPFGDGMSCCRFNIITT